MKGRLLAAALLCVASVGISAGCGGSAEPENTAEAVGAGTPAGTGEHEEAVEYGDTGESRIIPGRMELLEYEDGDSENLADLLQRNGSGMMVQIQSGSLLGSGVICGAEEEKLLILTAAHVLTADWLLVTFDDGGSAVTEDFECFASGDFALVRIPFDHMSEESLESCVCANIDKGRFDAAVAGTGCIVMGSRTGVAKEAYEGMILDNWIYLEDYGQYMMWVRAEGMQGMSGGGVFDRQGYLLGILSGGNGDGELAVVPLSLILAEVEL